MSGGQGLPEPTLKQWDLETAVCLHNYEVLPNHFQGHAYNIEAIQCDTEKFLSGAGDQMVKFWDPRSARCSSTLQTGLLPLLFRSAYIRSLCYNEFKLCLATDGRSSMQGKIQILDMRHLQRELCATETSGLVAALQCSSDTLMASGGALLTAGAEVLHWSLLGPLAGSNESSDYSSAELDDGRTSKCLLQ